MKTFKDYIEDDSIDDNGIDYILIEIPKKIFENLKISTESYWQDSFYKNYKYRVDVATNHTQQRHVHIAKSKYINSKNQQVSWNIDGSRHDKKSFNAAIGSSKKVQDIAKQALSLNDTIALESWQKEEMALEHAGENTEYKPITIKVAT
ncbi:MAG: hypothetical protein DRG11_05205 [Epsilonproteobacteria bacterium]|nr:MAG: hypothetical protein DRG11_05205 [Campylobacterota bacterium]